MHMNKLNRYFVVEPTGVYLQLKSGDYANSCMELYYLRKKGYNLPDNVQVLEQIYILEDEQRYTVDLTKYIDASNQT